MKQIDSKILDNREIAPGHFKLTFEAAAISIIARPGQFINVKITDGFVPLLRRPFSIHRAKPQLTIIYKIVGEGTEILSKKKPGERLDIIGPLGNGFGMKAKNAILVAGGMGVAPLAFLAEKLKAVNTTVIIGAKTKKHLICVNEFKKLGCKVLICTDDGSAGKKAFATDLLKNVLSSVNCHLSTVYSCGPKPMLEEVCSIAREYKVPAQVSLEEHMACGIGACLGCVVKVKDNKAVAYKRVCKDGPVFNACDIAWEQ